MPSTNRTVSSSSAGHDAGSPPRRRRPCKASVHAGNRKVACERRPCDPRPPLRPPRGAEARRTDAGRPVSTCFVQHLLLQQDCWQQHRWKTADVKRQIPISREKFQAAAQRTQPGHGRWPREAAGTLRFRRAKTRVPLQAFEKRGLFAKAATGRSRPRVPPDYSAGRLAPARVGLRAIAYRLRRGLHQPELAAAISKKGFPAASVSEPARSPRISMRPPTADSRAEKRKARARLPRRTGDRAHPAAAQSSPMPASRTKGRKRGGTAARPDRYAAQISSTIDSEASATSATSVRPPSNTATSTANRRRSPTSR